MADLVLIVTRHGLDEWDTTWGLEADASLQRYDISGDVILAGSGDGTPVLMVMNGLMVTNLEHFAESIRAVINSMKVYSVVHGENDKIKNLFNLSPATYSLGNNNIPPEGSLGVFVVKLATTIKEKNINNTFQTDLEALKSAIRGDRLSKAMGSFLTALAPLSLIQDETIRGRVCKSLDDLVLDAAVKDDLCTIFANMSNELSVLAKNIEDPNQMAKVVDWALQNDSLLKSLARRYL